MIKVLYSGYMVRDMCGNHHACSTVGKDPEPVKGYFCLCDDDIETLNDFGSVKIHAVIGERLDEYDMLIWEEGDDLPLVQYSGLLTDRQGNETPFKIINGENTYSQDNGNQLKIFFDDEAPQTNPEPPINPVANNLEQQQNQTKERKKLKPIERDANEGLLLVYEICNNYSIKYLDEMPAVTAWRRITSTEFISEYVKNIANNKKSIMLKNGSKLEQCDFSEKYRKRFQNVSGN